jgi:fumarate reductase flavoprotein subunit
MMVDTKAQRFVDEGQNFVFLSNGIAHHDDANPPYAVFDDAIWQEAGRHFFWPPNPNLLEQGGTLHVADTIAELAALAELPLQTLTKTIAAHNAAIAEDVLETLVPARGNANKDARPIAKPPFYAAPACVGLTHTMGGVRIDTEGRVLRADGNAIPGLFAAGDVTGGLEGGPTVAYIGGLQEALIFGLRTAEAIAGANDT